MAPTWLVLLRLVFLAGVAVVGLAGIVLALWLLLHRKRTGRGFEVMPPK